MCYTIDSCSVIETVDRDVAKHARQLRAQADEADRKRRVWEQLSGYLERGWHFHLLDLFREEKSILDEQVGRQGVAAAFASIIEQAEKESAAILRRFPTYLLDACTDVGLKIDEDSRHPRYTFHQGFMILDVDEASKVAKLSDYEGLLVSVRLDCGAIAESIKREEQRLFNRQYDGSRFLGKVRNQYLAVITKSGLKEGDPLPIRHITRRLGKNEKGFRSDEFSVDLARLIERGPMEVGNLRLDLQHTKDVDQGMLLPGFAGRGYIGFVSFARVLPGSASK